MPLLTEITRRSFLTTSLPALLAPRLMIGAQMPIERGRFSEEDVPLAQRQLLKMVNEERAKAGLRELELDDLACRVAGSHALDMAKGEFLSHWGTDGSKPYHRYSFAGGVDAVLENVSSADIVQSVTPNGVLGDLHDMHLSMLEEKPPEDGHRRTILSRSITHVGFGIGLQGHHLRLDELYIARCLQVEPVLRSARTKESILFIDKLLDARNILTGIDVYYEPFPEPPKIEWLREPRSYGLPTQYDTLLPKLPPSYYYPDGGSGVIDLHSNGSFRVRVPLGRKPGINTIVAWLKTGTNGTQFPASQICVRVNDK